MRIRTEHANVLAVGDLHLRKTCPAMRTDDFFAAQERKLKSILTIAEEQDCSAVIFPGDVFDRSDAPYSLIEWAIKLFWSHDLLYFFVFGQHDLRYHTKDYRNTPLGVLSAGLPGKSFILLPDSPLLLETDLAEVAFWGCSWGDELPRDNMPGLYNVVVMHRPVTVEKLPWEHKDLITTTELVKTCKADLFITGDNHTQFCIRYKLPWGHKNPITATKHSIVLNLGSVMRTTIAQIDHHPAVAIISFDAGRIGYSLRNLLVRKGIFDMEAGKEQKEKEDRLTAFVNSLQGEFDPELRFIDNLRLAAKEAPQEIQDVIGNVLRSC